MLVYLWSSNLSQISLKKNFFRKMVFQIFEIELTQNENQLFERHSETV